MAKTLWAKIAGAWQQVYPTPIPEPVYNAATGGSTVDVPNYNGTGETWRVHTFTASGTLTVTSSVVPFKTLRCAGGGGGGGSNNAAHGGGGGGANVRQGDFTLAVGDHTATVGAAGQGTSGNTNGTAGGSTTLGALTTATGGVGGTANAGGTVAGTGGSNLTSTITGASVVYGQNAPDYNSSGVASGPGGGGRGGMVGTNPGSAGQPGSIIVAYRIA